MVLSLGDDNSDRTTFPVVNVALIAANLLVFVLFQGLGSNTDCAATGGAVTPTACCCHQAGSLSDSMKSLL